VLAALTGTDVFACGASYFGVAELIHFAEDTHDFESRYLDGLIGPWPEARELFRERSPIHHADGLSAPLILFQGGRDPVVPPEQAHAMAAVLEAKGIPHALVEFPDESHGFRRAESVERVAQAELSFLGLVLGFAPAGGLPPLDVRHADALHR
jgi:dipeptidyl aminopeptidase/acylaminoacyl peptidase